MNNLIPYASAFVTYFLTNFRNTEVIERIILFGSVARGEATPQSDVDIFIEVKKKTKKLESEIRNIEALFYQSREAAIFKARGIDNKLSIKLGKLAEWKELAASIAATGIILYGPYDSSASQKAEKPWLIISWDKIGKNRGSFLNKLYGVTINKKRYEGLLSKIQGKKLGKSSIMVPLSAQRAIAPLLAKHRVHARFNKVYAES